MSIIIIQFVTYAFRRSDSFSVCIFDCIEIDAPNIAFDLKYRVKPSKIQPQLFTGSKSDGYDPENSTTCISLIFNWQFIHFYLFILPKPFFTYFDEGNECIICIWRFQRVIGFGYIKDKLNPTFFVYVGRTHVLISFHYSRTFLHYLHLLRLAWDKMFSYQQLLGNQ